MDEGTPDRAPPETATSDSGGASIFEDVAALMDDGRTLVEAELAFQKTRLSYAGYRGKNAAIFGLFAVIFLVLAVFALVFGTLLALVPVLGGWGATGVVAGVLLALTALLTVLALRNVKMISHAFREDS